MTKFPSYSGPITWRSVVRVALASVCGGVHAMFLLMGFIYLHDLLKQVAPIRMPWFAPMSMALVFALLFWPFFMFTAGPRVAAAMRRQRTERRKQKPQSAEPVWFRQYQEQEENQMRRILESTARKSNIYLMLGFSLMGALLFLAGMMGWGDAGSKAALNIPDSWGMMITGGVGFCLFFSWAMYMVVMRYLLLMVRRLEHRLQALQDKITQSGGTTNI